MGLGGQKGTQISKIEARGEVVITSDQDQTTTSDWALYDVPAQMVTVGGNVVLMQGKNVLKGDRLVIDLKTGESRFENKGNTAAGGRIRALFMPEDAKPGDDSSKDGKSGGKKSADKSVTKTLARRTACRSARPRRLPPLRKACPCRSRRARAIGPRRPFIELEPAGTSTEERKGSGQIAILPRPQAAAERGVAQPEEHGHAQDAEPNPYAGWLTVHSVVKAFKKRVVVRGVSLEVAARRGRRAARAERRRQDHRLLHDHRTDPGRRRRDPHRRTRRDQAADVSPRTARHRLPAAGSLDLPRSDR